MVAPKSNPVPPKGAEPIRSDFPEKLAYRIDEAAHASGIGRTSLYELIGSGQLKAFKAAGRRLIMRSDLEAFLASCRE
jgi:excisionase family DNA binding protein